MPESLAYPICSICDKEDPGIFPPWETVLYICSNCPRRKEFLRLQEDYKTRTALEMVDFIPKEVLLIT